MRALYPSSRRAWLLALTTWLSAGALASCGARSVLDAPGGIDSGGAGAGASGAGGAGGGGSDSKIISLSDKSAIESEAHVASASNGFVAVTWISIPADGPGGIGYTFSVNDGDSFLPVTVIQSPEGRDSSDPVLAVDGERNFWLTWVGFYRDPNTGEPFDMRIYVAKAAAGTTSFGEPVEASDPSEGSFADKPWITITGQGALLVTYGREGPGGWGIVAARSSDGVNWERAVIAEDPLQSNSFRNLAFPCAVAGAPTVYVVYVQVGSDPAIRLHRSDDDGVSFAPGTELQVNGAGELVAFDGPNCVASGEDVWVSYGLSNVGGGSEQSAVLFAVRLAHSMNAGKSIDTRINAHDDQAASFFLHPQIAREESGAMDLVYYAGNFDLDADGSFRRSRSIDNGQTFGPSVRVGKPIVFLPDRGDPRWLGDYTGAAWRAGALYMAYTDNASGFAHVAFSRAAVP